MVQAATCVLVAASLFGAPSVIAPSAQTGNILEDPGGVRQQPQRPEPAIPMPTLIDVVLGEGAEAAQGDVVTISYRGALQNGKVVDETAKRPPFAFVLGSARVIHGLDNGLLGMRAGGRRMLSIPSSLAYGERGLGTRIPPNATLVFDVELLRVDKPRDRGRVVIEELRNGDGATASNGDNVEVHYTGAFLNGHKFDSSIDRGQPFALKLGTTRIIKGFEQGILGMKVGGKRKVTVPYYLGYGERGVQPSIPAYATLTFEIELLKIEGR